MPVTAIRRRIVNPARRKRNASPKRKLTAAQVLAGFGGKTAQARALAAAGRATKTTARKKKRSTTRKNPSQAIRVALRNSSPPQTKGDNTVRRKRSTSTRRRTAAKRRNPAPRARAARRSTRTRTVTKYRYRTRRSNPVRRRTRRRANPRQIQALGMLRKAAMVSAGAIGTRLSVQAALGSKNTGATGVVANLVASLVLGALVSSITKKREDGHMVTIGGFAGTLLRLAQDSTPLGKQASLSGVGDLGIAGLGKYGPALIMHPSQTEGGQAGRPAMVPQQLKPVPVPAPAANGMNGYSRNQRFAARY